jgi:hypothetical protein
VRGDLVVGFDRLRATVGWHGTVMIVEPIWAWVRAGRGGSDCCGIKVGFINDYRGY